MKQIAIYEVNPAPWGNNHRLVESFDTLEDTKKVRKVLEEVNIDFKVYRVLVWTNSQGLEFDSWIEEGQ